MRKVTRAKAKRRLEKRGSFAVLFHKSNKRKVYGMKLKNKCLGFLACVCGIIFCGLILSGCGGKSAAEHDASVVMIKNAGMSTYGTGFAVGVPGSAADTVVTAYSVIATPNGAAPKTAVVRINEAEKDLSADVVFFDAGRNVAFLKLSEPVEDLEPMLLKKDIGNNEIIYARGYDGTGNIMSNFEDFNTTDIIQYSGNIGAYDDVKTMLIYQYSNEFNRAVVGAPAMDKKGNAVGMCAYSLSGMNTYSQYILSSAELIGLLSYEDIDFMTSDEAVYKNIIILSIILGVVLLAAITASALIYGKKKGNNINFKDRYIRVTDGILRGRVYKFNGKMSIGRDNTKCDIAYPIDAAGVSAVHCTLQMVGKECYLVDNFSKYGTFLADGTKIAASSPHKIEDKKFVFYIADPKNRFEFIDKKELGK